MKIQGQSYESVVDCVSFSDGKLHPMLHLSAHRIDKSAIVKIYIFSGKGKNYVNPISPDYHPHPSGDHSHLHQNHSDGYPKHPKNIRTTILSILINISIILMTINPDNHIDPTDP